MTRYNIDFNNANLPSGAPIASQLAAMSTLRSWWRVDVDNTLVSGAVSAITPRAGTSSASLAQADAAKRPVYTDGVFGRYPAAAFDGTADVMVASELPYTKTGAFTWSMICSVTAAASEQYLMALFASVGASTTMTVRTDGSVGFQHGNATVSVNRDFRSTPLLIVASSTGSQVKLRVNGVDATPAATNNAQTASYLTIGAASTLSLLPAAARIADVFVWQQDILADTAALDLLQAYAARAYGVDIA